MRRKAVLYELNTALCKLSLNCGLQPVALSPCIQLLIEGEMPIIFVAALLTASLVSAQSAFAKGSTPNIFMLLALLGVSAECIRKVAHQIYSCCLLYWGRCLPGQAPAIQSFSGQTSLKLGKEFGEAGEWAQSPMFN